METKLKDKLNDQISLHLFGVLQSFDTSGFYQRKKDDSPDAAAGAMRIETETEHRERLTKSLEKSMKSIDSSLEQIDETTKAHFQWIKENASGMPRNRDVRKPRNFINLRDQGVEEKEKLAKAMRIKISSIPKN